MLVECGQRNKTKTEGNKENSASPLYVKINEFRCRREYVNLYLIGRNEVSIWLLFARAKCVYSNISCMYVWVYICHLVWVIFGLIIIFYINNMVFQSKSHRNQSYRILVFCADFLVVHFIVLVYKRINCGMKWILNLVRGERKEKEKKRWGR